jgi:site-specific recombinase XerD
MKLTTLINQYIDYKKSLGMKFESNEYCLHAFCRYMKKNISLNQVSMKHVNDFLYGGKPVTSRWFIKYTALKGFYRYAASRGYIKDLPLPRTLPKRPPSFIPYIYTRDELKIIFKLSLTYQKRRSIIEPYTIHVILILLYGTGLRVSEALSLKVSDVDLSSTVITVREAKFYKTRLVPFSKQIANVLTVYKLWRKNHGGMQNSEATFFMSSNGLAIKIATLQDTFLRIRKQAKIQREGKASCQPRLHDLRHTFAVHRLTFWYQSKLNVQILLPFLSVYMGHAKLSATSIYLTMTPELLDEAGMLFERYVIGDTHD